MLRRSIPSFNNNNINDRCLFTHVFGLKNLPLQPSSAFNRLDDYLLRHGLTRSYWWTLDQAKYILQHHPLMMPGRSSSSKISSMLSLFNNNGRQNLFSSSGVVHIAEYFEGVSLSKNQGILNLDKLDEIKNLKHLSNIDHDHDNEPLSFASSSSLPSFLQATREALEKNFEFYHHHNHNSNDLSHCSRFCLFLSFNKKENCWKNIPPHLHFEASMKINSNNKSNKVKSNNSEAILEMTIKLRNLLRKELSPQSTNNDSGSTEQQRPSSASLLERNIKYLRFCLFEEEEENVETHLKCDNEMITVFPVEQLVPFSSLYVKAPSFHDNNNNMIVIPFMLTPPIVAATTIDNETNNAEAMAENQQNDNEKININKKPYVRSPPVVPIPLHPSAIASLIASQNLHKFRSPLWVRLVNNNTAKNKNASSSLSPTSSPGILPEWLIQSESPPALQGQEEKETDEVSSRPEIAKKNPLTPPPLRSSSNFTKNTNNNQQQFCASSQDYINSLIRQYHLHNNNNNIQTSASSSCLLITTNVTEHSESEAICLDDLPSELRLALPELARFIPKWVRSEQERILTGDGGKQDVLILGNDSAGKKIASTSSPAIKNHKHEVLVLGLFGQGFSLWKLVRKSTIRQPQNHVAKFLQQQQQQTNNHHNNDDDNNIDRSTFGWTSKKNKNNNFSNQQNNFGKSPRLFVTISYLRHATTCKDLEMIKNFISPEELDPESLESFLLKEKKKLILSSTAAASLSPNEAISNNKMSETEQDCSQRLRRRGLGPLRTMLETFLSQTCGHTVASFPKQMRQAQYVNFDQIFNEISYAEKEKEKDSSHQEQEPVAVLNEITNEDVDEVKAEL